MSKIPAILSATLTAAMAACADDHTPIGQPVTTPLVASDTSTVGQVSIFNSTDGLFITATPVAGWELRETRLSVTLSLSRIPKTRAGKPDLDRFLLQKHSASVSGEMAYALPLLVEPGTELFIALYAELHQLPPPPGKEVKSPNRENTDCDTNDKTVAWAAGTPFLFKDGSMYLTYTVRDSAPVTLLGQYRTHTQESWGAAPDLKNAAGYLSTNFAAAFPSGVTVGSDFGPNARFTSAQAVADFLPQAGTSGPLTSHYVNPHDLANPFAGDTLALALNLGFDAMDPSFSAGSLPFGSLVIADPASALYGLSVQDVLGTANKLLGGQGGGLGVAPEDVYDAVSRINANFEGGSVDGGFLGLP